MRKIILLVTVLVFCLSQGTWAEEYQAPENLQSLIDVTYNILYQPVDVDQNLYYDIFLFDDYCMALSALAHGGVSGMSLDSIKEYYQDTVDQYEPAKNFLLMVLVSDPDYLEDPTNFASHVVIRNSKNEVIVGEEYENYANTSYIVSFPKAQIEKLLENEQNITIQITSGKDQVQTITYNRNYSEQIPAEMTKLLNVLREPLPETGADDMEIIITPLDEDGSAEDAATEQPAAEGQTP